MNHRLFSASPLLLTLLVLLMLLGTGCATVYKPNMHNVPIFTEKGEIRATISPSQAQAAYAVTDNIGVMANMHYQNNNQQNALTSSNGWSTDDVKQNRFFAEGGVGMYSPLGDDFVFEIYGGGGTGSIDNQYWGWRIPNDERRRFTATTTRYFMQPSIGFTSEVIDIAFSTRFTTLQLRKVQLENFLPEELPWYEFSTKMEEPVHSFFEPAVTMRIGYKWLKLHGQIIYVAKISPYQLSYNPVQINMGIHFNISDRFKAGHF